MMPFAGLMMILVPLLLLGLLAIPIAVVVILLAGRKKQPLTRAPDGETSLFRGRTEVLPRMTNDTRQTAY